MKCTLRTLNFLTSTLLLFSLQVSADSLYSNLQSTNNFILKFYQQLDSIEELNELYSSANLKQLYKNKTPNIYSILQMLCQDNLDLSTDDCQPKITKTTASKKLQKEFNTYLQKILTPAPENASKAYRRYLDWIQLELPQQIEEGALSKELLSYLMVTSDVADRLYNLGLKNDKNAHRADRVSINFFYDMKRLKKDPMLAYHLKLVPLSHYLTIESEALDYYLRNNAEDNILYLLSDFHISGDRSKIDLLNINIEEYLKHEGYILLNPGTSKHPKRIRALIQ